MDVQRAKQKLKCDSSEMMCLKFTEIVACLSKKQYEKIRRDKIKYKTNFHLSNRTWRAHIFILDWILRI